MCPRLDENDGISSESSSHWHLASPKTFTLQHVALEEMQVL